MAAAGGRVNMDHPATQSVLKADMLISRDGKRVLLTH